jgi:hypothetical protein
MHALNEGLEIVLGERNGSFFVGTIGTICYDGRCTNAHDLPRYLGVDGFIL